MYDSRPHTARSPLSQGISSDEKIEYRYPEDQKAPREHYAKYYQPAAHTDHEHDFGQHLENNTDSSRAMHINRVGIGSKNFRSPSYEGPRRSWINKGIEECEFFHFSSLLKTGTQADK